MTELLHLFVTMFLVSLLSYGGGAGVLFYQFGVIQTGWISKTDISAVLAFGYATPGPMVYSIAPFIGYRVDGLAGVLIASLGVFILPWALALLAAKHLHSLV